MSTAVIGTGNIGSALARHLVAGGEPIVLAASDPPEALARQLGGHASAASVSEAIEAADTVIFAVWFDVIKNLISQNLARLDGKIVADTSNPVAPDDKGDFHRTLPDGVSSGSVIAGLIPASAHFVKGIRHPGRRVAERRGQPDTYAGCPLLRHRRRPGPGSD